MRRLTLIPVAILGCLFFTNPAHAQFPNSGVVAPATKLESLETATSVVILKATTVLGSVPGKGGAVTVKCRETTDTSTGHKERGLAIEIAQKGQPRDTLLIDYDEVASLADAVGYLSKLDPSVTPLAGFDAAYTTKGGFRVAALGARSTGAVQFAMRDARTGSPPVIFPPEGMASFSGLINQAKAMLDSLGGGAAAAPTAPFTAQAATPGARLAYQWRFDTNPPPAAKK